MRRISWCLLGCVSLFLACSDVSLNEMQDATETRLRAGADSVLTASYAAREYAPRWTQRDQLRPAADTLLARLCHAEDHGLDPGDYDVRRLASLYEVAYRSERAPDSARARTLADLEIALSEAFLSYAHDLRMGAGDVRPTVAPLPGSAVDTTALLGVQTMAELGTALTPPQEGYAALQNALRRYQAIEAAGGWPLVPRTLQPGASIAEVQRLRERLTITGDLDASGDGGYDKALLDAVRTFQQRHGLPRTGLVDAATLAALNVPARQRVEQLTASLERRRWLPQALGSRYLLVNLADDRVYGMRDGSSVWRTAMSRTPACAQPAPRADSVQAVVFGPSGARLVLAGTADLSLSEAVPTAPALGCFRVADAAGLVAFALEGQGRWNERRVRETLATPAAEQVTLETPLPVYILPLAAWVENDGSVQLRAPTGADAALAQRLRPDAPQRTAAACQALGFSR